MVFYGCLLLLIYGAAQVEHKQAFLTELVLTCAKESDPVLVGGDSCRRRTMIDMKISCLMLLLVAWT